VLRPTTRAGALALAALVFAGCGTRADDPADLGQPIPSGSPAAESPSAAPTAADATPSPDRGTAAGADSAADSTPIESTPLGRPVSLQFAEYTSPVVSVGSDAAANLEIPGDINTLGWWRDGAEPGAAEGFVVITGHATRDGRAAANLWWSAEPGDTIVLETEQGSITYRVVSRKTYDVSEVPLARWFPADGPSGPPALALITCADYRDGDWQANTVVDAVPA
jgi:hypothetical protein